MKLTMDIQGMLPHELRVTMFCVCDTKAVLARVVRINSSHPTQCESPEGGCEKGHCMTELLGSWAITDLH